MKGLTGVLNKFSDGLRTRKILPSLVEEVRFKNITQFIVGLMSTITDERYELVALHPTERFFHIKLADI